MDRTEFGSFSVSVSVFVSVRSSFVNKSAVFKCNPEDSAKKQASLTK